MKVTGIRALRSQFSSIVGGDQPVLVTKHGKLAGVFLPLEDPDHLPTDLRRELAAVLGRYLSAQLDAKEVGEEEIREDFAAQARPGRETEWIRSG